MAHDRKKIHDKVLKVVTKIVKMCRKIYVMNFDTVLNYYN